MSEWREIELGEISKRTTSGGTPSTKISEYYDGEIPWLNTKEISFNRIRSTEKTISESGLENSSAKWIDKNSVIVAMYGATAAKVAINKIPLTTNQACCNLIINEELADYNFVFYAVWNNYDELENIAVGAAQQNLSVGVISKFTILLPPLEEQKSIASALSSLDDKIDLLHRQNKTLEQMAETLFRQWFVEEADESWEVVQLQDVAEIKNGFAFSSKSYVDFSPEHLEVLKMGHIEKGGGLRTDPKRDYAPREERLERYILDKGDIIMAMTDMKDNVVILGVPAMIDESDRYVLNQRVARIYLKNRNDLLNEYLLYVQLKDPDFIAELQSKANSGVQVNLSTASIKESEILIPPMELQLEKGNSITDLYLKKECNDKQIKNLTKLRDTLLPKLMSGEVKVAN